MKKIILAPDSFKGCLTALEVCEIWREAGERVFTDAQFIPVPISDGGEGFVDAVFRVRGGSMHTVCVSDPLRRDIEAKYLMLHDKTAVIEMAAASGLTLLTPDEQDPTMTSSFGAGELIMHAVDHGAEKIILGLGGSATNDGGIGAASALGLKLLKSDGSPVSANVASLVDVAAIDSFEYKRRIEGVTFTIACDVTNPLCGPYGASFIFGPQKGASPAQTEVLDKALENLSIVIERDCGKHCADVPGCGAAGGFALPLLSYGYVEIKPGIDVILELAKFDDLLKDADIVLCGEGRTDEQSAMGKAVSGIAKKAHTAGVHVVVLSGALAPQANRLYDMGVTALFSACTEPMSLSDAIANGRENLSIAAENLFRMLKI